MPRRIASEGPSRAALRHYRDVDVTWIGAANRAAPAPSGPPSVLSLEQALDLAVLGLTMARPLLLERVAELLRRIMSPPLQPTLEVVDARLQDLARRGLVVIAAQRPGRMLVRRSSAGLRYARTLLRTPGPLPGAAHRDLAFMLKVCMLDVLADGDRAAVVAELRRDLQTALAAAEEAARHCRSTSAYAHHWLERQVARLRGDICWLEGVTAGSPG